MTPADADGTLAAIGSYTSVSGGRGSGITLARLHPDAINLGESIDAPSPSFLVWAPYEDVVYAAHETPQGSIGAYAHYGRSLVPLGDVPSEGGRPCHVSVHPSGRFIACSNYAGGTFATFPVKSGGGLKAARGVITHSGSGAHPTRQNVPHPHTVSFTPDGRHAILVDISLDTLSIHRVDDEVRGLDAAPEFVIRMPSGSGPRHVAWHPSGDLVVVGEIDATLALLRWSAGELRLVSSGHPASSGGKDAWPSEVTVDSKGRLVVACRRTSTLALHAMAADGTSIEMIKEIPLRPENARYFALIDDTAYVALQGSDSLVAVNLTSGLTTAAADLGSPACIAVRGRLNVDPQGQYPRVVAKDSEWEASARESGS